MTYDPPLSTSVQPPADAAGPVRRRPRRPWVTGADARAAALVVGTLLLVGAVAGWPWQQWSPRTVGLVYNSAGIVPDETEAFVAADARFVIITGLLGLAAGVAVWLRRSWRGPLSALALAVGGVGGSVLTAVIGRATGGGTDSGRIGTLVRLPIRVHATQLVLAEPLVALLVFLVCAAFIADDGLGHPGEAAESLPGSVVGREEPEGLQGRRDAAGLPEQDGLAAQ